MSSREDRREAARRLKEIRKQLEEAKKEEEEVLKENEELKKQLELQNILLEKMNKKKEDLLECPTCKGFFNTAEKVPSFLECGHTVCGECVKQMAQVAHREFDRNRVTIQCPECREEIEVPYPFNPQAYRRNEDLITFMEALQ
uniref:RING-type domain-containing protein n=1 Tax=Caenorhabditis tropicalis TaxID=1561998 RepID=A0A1I7TPD2_9PELO